MLKIKPKRKHWLNLFKNDNVFLKRKKMYLYLSKNVKISNFIVYADPGCYDIVEMKLQNETDLSTRDITTIGSKSSITIWNANVNETNG